ncbi:DUF4190 domain-containing protein [Herbiconiux ginsengi]|uniref:DUF4190 domain-containing protein n=1 Tax=Herbiconiux ginsengi TaxID=381665 RepID=A0A1H3MHL6_9MICO|nr:DUF4190 domain-containing protein [Herbiconiux ginsengi]SDY76197.1 protein of unknown function [Herbiconiux ginsengi]
MTNDTPTPESSPTSASTEGGATETTEIFGGTAPTAAGTFPAADTGTLPAAGTLPASATATATLPPPAPASVPLYPGYQAPAAPQPPAAPAPQPAQLYPPQPKTNILGIITLVLGILGFGVVPVITGHIALSQIKKTGEDGRGLTLAGLILGYVTVAGWLLVAFFWVAVAGFALIGAAASSY